MRITMSVLLVVGIIEIGVNLYFLIHAANGMGFNLAKKFHGDFPAFASNHAWMVKIIASMILGVIAVISAISIYQNYESKIILSALFAFGMLLMGIIQALKYGKKHLPSLLSIIFGIAFVALVFFRP